MPHRLFLLGLCILWACSTSAHDARYENHMLREWKIKKPERLLKASFYFTKGGLVYLEDAKGRIHSFPLTSLGASDRTFVEMKAAQINHLQQLTRLGHTRHSPNPLSKDLIFLLCIPVLAAVLFWRLRQKSIPVLVGMFLGGCSLYLFSFRPRPLEGFASLSAETLDSAFVPFKPKVYTRWDQNWFYVESKGLADHEMMTGITKWQQQVPIPQCYTGSNAWQIPLHPVVASNPIPVNNQHFLRGAIALAVNGIPIFNPYTNTGVDAFLDGQLDQWGGHSGRADDYHYHIAPLHLYGQSNPGLPIAFGLDGYPVYGSLEPDGTPMQTLDDFHGHLGTNGVYHYHGTAAAPYMIGKMKGQVTEDATLQIIPQPSAHPVRPSGTPLTGATITGFASNGTGNGYNMTYTRNGQSYAWNYSWTPGNVFTFHYIAPTGTTTTNYNGQTPCFLPTGIPRRQNRKNCLGIFPNPAEEKITITLPPEVSERMIQSTRIVNTGGSQIWGSPGFQSELDIRSLPKGSYQIQLETPEGVLTQKLLIP